MRFNGTNHRVAAPGSQNGKDELSRMALRIDHCRPVRRGSFRCAFQLRKGPALSGSQVAQSDLVALVAGNFLPAFVKHPLFRKAITVSAASLIFIIKFSRKKRAKGGGGNNRATSATNAASRSPDEYGCSGPG